jgi:hypothetical protein
MFGGCDGESHDLMVVLARRQLRDEGTAMLLRGEIPALLPQIGHPGRVIDVLHELTEDCRKFPFPRGIGCQWRRTSARLLNRLDARLLNRMCNISKHRYSSSAHPENATCIVGFFIEWRTIIHLTWRPGEDIFEMDDQMTECTRYCQ